MSELFEYTMRPIARFRDLASGERFRFPGSSVIHTKTTSGYKTDGDKRTWRTGAAVSVIPVSQES